MWTVIFWASEVAALLGKHRYQPRGHALLKALEHQRDPAQQVLRGAVRADPACAAVVAARLPPLPALAGQTAATVTAESTETLRPALHQAVAHARSAAASWTAVGPLPSSPLDKVSQVSEAHAAAATAATTRAARLDALLTAPDPAPLLAALREEATVQAGTRLEREVLTGLEARLGAVGARNSASYTLCGHGFAVCGRVDGRLTADGTVVEVKTRRNWFREPPEYDVIQLQIYLRMLEAARGLLVEVRQDDPTKYRETIVEAAAFQWEEALRGLEAAAADVRAADLDTARRWAGES